LKGLRTVARSRHAWIDVARGAASVNGELLRAGDAAAIDGPGKIDVVSGEAVEVLLFDLA
jgi:quercetin 2,3-dioxygenase